MRSQGVDAAPACGLKSLAREAGFGMIELLIAMSVLSIGILAVFTLHELRDGPDPARRLGLDRSGASPRGAWRTSARSSSLHIGLADTEVAAADTTYTADAA